VQRRGSQRGVLVTLKIVQAREVVKSFDMLSSAARRSHNA
jgi:hypothetical protein